jgi:hypothetical protein
MKKMILGIILSISIGFAATNYKYCVLENKTVFITEKDNFGNVKKVRTNKLKEFVFNLANSDLSLEDKKTIMKIWSEIFALNKNYYKNFFENVVDRAVNFKVYTTILQIDIQKGILPTQLNLNISNLQTKKMKINTTVSIYSLAGALLTYDSVYKDFDLSRDRMLALLAYLIYKNHPVIPATCKSNEWEVSSINEHILRQLVRLILEKDTDTIKLVFMLVNNKFDSVDKFLLKNKEVSNLFKVAKKNYVDLSKIKFPQQKVKKIKKVSICPKREEHRFLVRYLCFQNKNEAEKVLSKLEHIKSKKKRLNEFLKLEKELNNKEPKYATSGGTEWYLSLNDVNSYLNKHYCRLHKKTIINKLIYDSGSLILEGYCIIYYIDSKPSSEVY